MVCMGKGKEWNQQEYRQEMMVALPGNWHIAAIAGTRIFLDCFNTGLKQNIFILLPVIFQKGSRKKHWLLVKFLRKASSFEQQNNTFWTAHLTTGYSQEILA